MPRRQRQLLLLVGVVDGGLQVDGDGVVSRDFGGNVEGQHGEHGVAAGRKQGEGRGAAQVRAAAHLTAQKGTPAPPPPPSPVPQRVLPAGVEVYDPVHWHLSSCKLAVKINQQRGFPEIKLCWKVLSETLLEILATQLAESELEVTEHVLKENSINAFGNMIMVLAKRRSV